MHGARGRLTQKFSGLRAKVGRFSGSVVGDLSRVWKYLGFDALVLVAFSALILTIIDGHALANGPLVYSDLVVPYLKGSAAVQLSSTDPWYNLFVWGTYSVAPGSYGSILNFVDIYSFSLVPVGMFVLLRQLSLSRLASMGGSILYFANPVVLALASPGYVEWSVFFLIAPLALALIVRYDARRETRLLLGAFLLAILLIQLDPIVGLRVIVPVLIGPALIPLLTFAPKDRSRTAVAYLISLSIFGILLFLTFLPSLGSLAFYYTSGSGSSSAFYQFHIANVRFTYQGQDAFNSLAGLTLYPSGTLWSYGYSTSFSWVVWFTTVAAGIFVAGFSRAKMQPYYLAFLATDMILIGFQIGVADGTLVSAFGTFPPLFEYEYPTYLNFIQIVYTGVFLGLLLDQLRRGVSFVLPGERAKKVALSLGATEYYLVVGPAVARDGRHSIQTSHGTQKVVIAGVVIALVVSIVVGSCYPILDRGDSNPANPTSSSQNYLPGYYDQLATFFGNHPGDYRVLTLPLNYTSLIRLYSVVPVTQIFGIPYGGLNAPGIYPNSTLLYETLALIDSNQSGRIAEQLATENVQYVIILNPNSTSALYLTTSIYNSYLDGGGSRFLSYFGHDSDFTKVLNTADFVILENQLYEGPLVTPDSVYLYESTQSPTAGNHSRQVTENPQFATSAGWSYWSSCAGPQSRYISFSNGSVTLTTCTGPNATYSSTHTPQTEVWQRIGLLPGQLVEVRVNLTKLQNAATTLIIIFHNASDNASFYSGDQMFPQVTPDAYGSFTYNVTAPEGALFAYLGLQVLNDTSTPANLTVTLLSASTQFFEVNSVTYSDLPVVQSGAVAFPLPAGSHGYASYFNLVRETSPAASILPAQVPYVLGDTSNGTIYLPSGAWNFSLFCTSSGTLLDYIQLAGVSSNATVTGGGVGFRVYAPGWQIGQVDCVSDQAQSITVQVSGIGYVEVNRIFTDSAPAPRTPMANLSVLGVGQSRFQLTASSGGVGTFYTSESSVLKELQDAIEVGTISWNGETLYILNISSAGTVDVELPLLQTVNEPAIASTVSVTVTVLALGLALASTGLYGGVRRVWDRLVLRQP